MLSVREREVMLLVAEGLSNREIARQLNMTESTAKVHLHSIFERTGAWGLGHLAVALSLSARKSIL
jgi:DNA-binding NarL/FixJ family response regulator